MAVINGSKNATGFTEVDFHSVSQNLNNYSFVQYPYEGSEYSINKGGSLSRQGSGSPKRIINGSKAKQFEKDYFDQIHLLGSGSLGAISGDSTLEFEIFNSFSTSITISSIDETNTVALSLVNMSPPVLMNPGQSFIFSVEATPNGPPQIEANYYFNFTPEFQGIEIDVTGSRIVAFPYRFADEFRENIIFLTSIITSEDGSEQRQKSRLIPRLLLAGESHISPEELPRINNILYNWRDKVWAVPLQFEISNLNEIVSQNDTLININTDNKQFIVGELAIIWEDSRKFQTFEVEAISSGFIESKQAISEDYFSGFVAPVKLFRMASNPSLITNAYDGLFQFQFESLDNSNLNSSLNSQPFGDGIEVFEEEMLSENQIINMGFINEVKVIDYNIGKKSFFADWQNSRVSRSYQIITESISDYRKIKEWIYRRFGRAIPYYRPSYKNDMIILNQGAISNVLIIKLNDHALHALNRTKIGILTTSSGWVYAEISSITNVGDGTERIDLNNTINVSPDDIEICSYVGMYRLSNDNINIVYRSNDVSIFNIQELELKP